jgi:hypothetical protein
MGAGRPITSGEDAIITVRAPAIIIDAVTATIIEMTIKSIRREFCESWRSSAAAVTFNFTEPHLLHRENAAALQAH